MKRVVRQFKTVYVGNPADPEQAYRHETETVWVNGRRVHHRNNRHGDRELPLAEHPLLSLLGGGPDPMEADWFGEAIPFPLGSRAAFPAEDLNPRTATVTVNTQPMTNKPSWTQKLQGWGRRIQAAAQAAWQELRRPG